MREYRPGFALMPVPMRASALASLSVSFEAPREVCCGQHLRSQRHVQTGFTGQGQAGRVFVTSSAADSEIHHEISAEQTMIVSKGEASFTLRFHLFHKGDPTSASTRLKAATRSAASTFDMEPS